MNFESMLRKLNAIGGMQGSVAEAKKPDADKDGIPDWADEDKKEKANEDIMKVMRGLQAIQEAEDEKCSDCGKSHEGECAVEESKKPDDDGDGIPNWADKKDDKEEVEEGVMDKVKAFGKKALDTLGHKDDEELIKDMQRKAGVPVTGKKPGEEEVKETDYSSLRHLAGIQEAQVKEDDVEEGNEFSNALKTARDAGEEEFEVGGKKYKVNECGDMAMSPMSVVGGEPQMGINPAMPAEVPTIGAQQEPEMAQMAEPEAPAATYTLSIRNGENNLQMTTDVPDEIIHIMKLAGVNKGAQVSQKPAGEEQKTDEAFGNTPAQTNEPNPRLMGDINDWSQKGTGRGKPEYPGTKASGDNPMHEALEMVLEYRKFKSNK